jgi:3-methyladenine DNA glycosylase AlkD
MIQLSMKERPITYKKVISLLESQANFENVAGMARFGINPSGTLGVPVRDLRKLAKKIGKDHILADQLWRSGIHEARILACLTDVPDLVTEEQMEKWAGSFDSWDVCDLCCNNLFRLTTFAYRKAVEWSMRGQEFVKRAGFVLMAVLAVHDKERKDDVFLTFLSIAEREAGDGRNFVRKAVNWALRQIGKRNRNLNAAAIETAHRVQNQSTKAAGWIARDALRELQSPATIQRIKR